MTTETALISVGTLGPECRIGCVLASTAKLAFAEAKLSFFSVGSSASETLVSTCALAVEAAIMALNWASNRSIIVTGNVLGVSWFPCTRFAKVAGSVDFLVVSLVAGQTNIRGTCAAVASQLALDIAGGVSYFGGGI